MDYVNVESVFLIMNKTPLQREGKNYVLQNDVPSKKECLEKIHVKRALMVLTTMTPYRDQSLILPVGLKTVASNAQLVNTQNKMIF